MEAAMTEPKTSVRDFERQGWSAEEVAVGYHHLSPVTTQAVGALPDARSLPSPDRRDCDGCGHGRRA
jgi:hypothetical protein